MTDNESATDDDIIQVIISQPNLPPTNLTVDGPTIGNKNIEYNYSATATDPDNDTIRYIFNWSDGTNDTTTDYFANGTTANVTHQWTSAGIYTIEVFAMDYPYNATSGLEYLTILIDALYVKDIGYLLDNDGNGVYDEFYSNETENKATTEYDSENGTYLINIDGVKGWDYIYDSVTDTLTECEGEEEAVPPKRRQLSLVHVGSRCDNIHNRITCHFLRNKEEIKPLFLSFFILLSILSDVIFSRLQQ